MLSNHNPSQPNIEEMYKDQINKTLLMEGDKDHIFKCTY